MQVRKWLISGEINYNVCRICSLTLLPPGSTHPDSDHAECITEVKQSNRQRGARAVDLPARSFDVARPV